MKALKIITWLKIERDFRLIGFMKKRNIHTRLNRFYSLIKFRMKQNEDLYEILIGIRDFDGKYITE